MTRHYFLVYKPKGMLSQFVSPYEHPLLGDLHFDFPAGTQAVGRLDADSEGLLILTTDKSLTRKLMHPDKRCSKKYSVQVKGAVSEQSLDILRRGIPIPVQGKGEVTTLPCLISAIPRPANLAEIEDAFNESLPHAWLEFTLTEGRKRQIRKMCKIIGHPVRRLIRTSIAGLSIGDMKPGEVKAVPEDFVLERIQS